MHLNRKNKYLRGDKKKKTRREDAKSQGNIRVVTQPLFSFLKGMIPVCRQQTADRIKNVDLVQNVDCRLQSGYKMQTENLKSFFVLYVITCHLITYRTSRNCFSAISFHDYLHYFGIFLAHILMKIDRNIISSLHVVFSLCARVGWCDV